ncbi:CD3337/EF1877 family mobilome membrane protein [Enterococcus hirae]
MKRKEKNMLFFLFLGKIFQSLPVSASAISEIGKYNLDAFGFRMVESSFLKKVGTFGFSEDFFNACGSLINFQLGISKVLWQGVDFLLQKILSFDVFNDVFGVFFKFSRQLFLELYNKYGLALILISIIFWSIKYLMGRRAEAKRGAFRFFGALLLSMMIFGFGGAHAQGEKLFKDVNTLFGQIEKSAFLISGKTEALGNFGSEDSLAKAVRNLYFEQSIVQPYLLMNYGTSDVKKLEKVGIDPTEFLFKSFTQKNIEECNKKIKKAYEVYEKAEKKVKVNGTKAEYYAYLGQDKLVYKEMVALFAPLMTISLGIPLLFVAVGKLVIDFAMCASALYVVFTCLLSFFPTCEGAVFGSVKKFIGFAFQKSTISVLFLLIYYVGGFIDTLIPPTTTFQFVMNAILKLIVFCFIFAKRKIIFEKMKLSGINKTMERSKEVRQNVSQTVRQAPSQMKESLQQKQQKAQNMAIKGAEIAGNVYRPLKYGAQMAKMARTVQEKRQGKREGQVINPLELEGRTPQAIGYGGHRVVYGQTDGVSPLAPKGGKGNHALTPVSMKEGQENGALATVDFLPIDRLIPATGRLEKNRVVVIQKPSKAYVGQKVSFVQRRPIPRLEANQTLSQQVGKLKEVRLQAHRLSTNVPVRTAQTQYTYASKNSTFSSSSNGSSFNGSTVHKTNEQRAMTDSFVKERMVRVAQSNEKPSMNRFSQGKEVKQIIQTKEKEWNRKEVIHQGSTPTGKSNSSRISIAHNSQVPKKSSVPPLPSGRTPQRM